MTGRPAGDPVAVAQTERVVLGRAQRRTLRAARKIHRLPIKAVCWKLGINQSTLMRWECGRTRPTRDQFNAWCDALSEEQPQPMRRAA